ncbi:MAG: apolipoprotein N-acyltransferase [Gammaproteobacteria bacterium]|nr:apolipoprotein N-acyltransferase [Gammaproteobacteria bacterium]
MTPLLRAQTPPPFVLPLLAIAAGAIASLAFAPFGWHWLAPLSLAALFALWHAAPPRVAAWRGWWYGVGMFGAGVSWIQVSIHKFGLPVYAFSVSVTAVFVMGMALYPALGGWLASRLRGTRPRFELLVVCPALWVLLEALRGWFLSGFPWLYLGYGQIDSVLAGYAPVAGALGASWAVATLGGCLAALALRLRKSPGPALALAAVVLAGGAALGRVQWTTASGGALPVALVQGAVPQEIKWQREYREPTLELYGRLSEPYWGRSIVVWPESAIPAFPQEIPEQLAAFGKRAAATGTSLLVGLPTGDPSNDRYYNSVVALGAGQGQYDKHHLVPFGEYLPLDAWIRPALDFLKIPMSSFSSGAARQVAIVAGGQRIGVTVCYEDAYSGEVRRALPAATLLVNVSDDAWFGDSIAPHQHLEIARMRAREAGRWLLRATNTGISAVIDERGGIRARSPQFKSLVLEASAEPRAGATPYVRFGDAPLLGALGLVVAGAAATRKPPRRQADW